MSWEVAPSFVQHEIRFCGVMRERCFIFWSEGEARHSITARNLTIFLDLREDIEANEEMESCTFVVRSIAFIEVTSTPKVCSSDINEDDARR